MKKSKTDDEDEWACGPSNKKTVQLKNKVLFEFKFNLSRWYLYKSLGKLCWMLKMQKQLAVLEVTLTVLENEELDFLSLQIKDYLNPRRQTQKSTRVKKVCHTSIRPTAAVIKTANLRFKWTFLKLVIQSLFNHFRVISNEAITVQKMKFSIQDFFRECDQIRRKLQIWSHLVTFHIRLLYITIFTFH